MSKPTNDDLLKRAIKNAPAPPGRKDFPKWAAVRDLLCVGSTTANELCTWAGVNPDLYIDGPVCDVCPDVTWKEE